MKTPRTEQLIDNINENGFGHKSSFECAIRLCEQLETELNEARTEIERKDQLIEQMREALCMADGLIDTLILDNTLSPSINAERMNIRAAIEAAERKNDDNQKL